MKKINSWEIPRADKRERCGECYGLMKKQISFKRRNAGAMRYPDVCGLCRSVFIAEGRRAELHDYSNKVLLKSDT